MAENSAAEKDNLDYISISIYCMLAFPGWKDESLLLCSGLGKAHESSFLCVRYGNNHQPGPFARANSGSTT